MKLLKSYFSILCSTAGILFLSTSLANANNNFSLLDPTLNFSPDPTTQQTHIFAQRGGMNCEGGLYKGENNCPQQGMRHGKGRRHGQGMQHGRGMRHGMRHGRGPGIDGEAQCPQTRSTEKAPEQFYSKTNPLKNTAENIEQGRLLFTLDAQPTCTVCHGSGNGLGMMSGGLTPPPRNFMCKETMQTISDGQLFWIIKNGSSGTGMPAFSDLNDEQVWQLILYIRQFTN